MDPEIQAAPQNKRIPLFIGGGVVALVLLGGAMMWHAEAQTNKVALSSSPKPVTYVLAKSANYRPSRTYVGTLQPWIEASVGPQLISAYVDTVLVRPGATVKRGEVLATLDCRNANAAQSGIASQARAIDARQRAVADESARTQGLLDGGFVSANEAEQKSAQSTSDLAQLEAMKAQLTGSSLQVGDCILRAPFDGEISTRAIDPGAFVRPGTAIVTVVDRSTIRMTADAPEIDFGVVAPATPVTLHVDSVDRDLTAVISRRAPAADPTTRTVHFEIDIPDPKREIPVGTTGEVHIDVGEPIAATEIPLYAATLRGSKGTVFVIDGDIAHARTFVVKGESGGSVFLDPSLPNGSHIITEGRALLDDGDRVAAKEAENIGTSAIVAAAPDAGRGKAQ